MEDLQTQQLQALAAHIEGLEAALQALPTDATIGTSLRRIARSLASAAEEHNASELAAAARRIKEADDSTLEHTARDLLRLVASLAGAPMREQIRVLLVEDNRTMAVAMQAYLKSPGYEVHHVATAAEAERILSTQSIDLVLLDLILPDRDGRDLLVQMRENTSTAAIPVVVLSAKEGAVPKAECLAVGAREFIEKPVEPAVLRAAVARHARRGGPPGGSAARPTPLPTRADLVEAYEPIRLETGRGAPAAVVLLSVNDFPLLLEALGDDDADALLTTIGSQMAASLEERDMLGRWGRGQLLTLLPRSSAADAKRLIKQGLAGLANSGVLDTYGGIRLAFSAGVAVGEQGQDLREVVSEAEQSMLRARASGRGVMVSADDTRAERPPRVLLVEDDRVTATLVHHRLVREGFEVMDFLNGEDAFQWATETDFDLAILDVKVPGMDGFELLERLRGIPRCEATPIVMLTGLGGESDVVRGLELGANDYMLKPFSPTELLARVRRLVYVGHTTADAAGPGPAKAAAR
jgi:two-component system cell cycle response regulator